jgi:mono/diheme cytochrome c family protein
MERTVGAAMGLYVSRCARCHRAALRSDRPAAALLEG